MLSIFAAVYSGLTFVFACIGVIFVVYKFYQWYFSRQKNNASLNQEFEDIRRERQQGEEAISRYAIDSSLDMHHKAHEVITRIQEQRTHLDQTIETFDQAVKDIEHANNGLNEAKYSMRALSEQMKTNYQVFSSFLSTITEDLKKLYKSMSVREKELVAVVQKLSVTTDAINKNAGILDKYVGNKKLTADYVAQLEEKNGGLKRTLSDTKEQFVLLREGFQKLADMNEEQTEMINILLEERKSGTTISYDCRLFGNRAQGLPLVNDMENQACLDLGSESLHTGTAITVGV